VDGACDKLESLPDAAPEDRRPGAVPVACAMRW
jgi:thioredoxin:protein disulfide reductase